LYRYSSEQFTTGVGEIDGIAADKSTDVNEYNILLEDSFRMLLEEYTPAGLILETYSLNSILPNVNNEDFRSEISVLDFSERNPFGEINV
jgi:hypothetical protein